MRTATYATSERYVIPYPQPEAAANPTRPIAETHTAFPSVTVLGRVVEVLHRGWSEAQILVLMAGTVLEQAGFNFGPGFVSTQA